MDLYSAAPAEVAGIRKLSCPGWEQLPDSSARCSKTRRYTEEELLQLGGKGVKGSLSLRQCVMMCRCVRILWLGIVARYSSAGTCRYTCGCQHSMTPCLTTQLMLEAGHLCMDKQPCQLGDKDRKPQDQLKVPISLLSLQGTTVGQDLLDLACLEVENPFSTILMKAGMRHGNKTQTGGLA